MSKRTTHYFIIQSPVLCFQSHLISCIRVNKASPYLTTISQDHNSRRRCLKCFHKLPFVISRPVTFHHRLHLTCLARILHTVWCFYCSCWQARYLGIMLSAWNHLTFKGSNKVLHFLNKCTWNICKHKEKIMTNINTFRNNCCKPVSYIYCVHSESSPCCISIQVF